MHTEYSPENCPCDGGRGIEASPNFKWIGDGPAPSAPLEGEMITCPGCGSNYEVVADGVRPAPEQWRRMDV